MNIKPMFDRVLALPITEENKTESGICLKYQETQVKKAKVVCTGSGIYEDGIFIEMQVKSNDIIFYEDHTVAKMFIDNTEHILIKQSDILAILSK
ncbi:MAG: hypothetical protein IJW32_01495 [Clostridia bacterium]|nr:hypothetical protein [Clostridia bacterium]